MRQQLFRETKHMLQSTPSDNHPPQMGSWEKGSGCGVGQGENDLAVSLRVV